jgi:hypothetical protein
MTHIQVPLDLPHVKVLKIEGRMGGMDNQGGNHTQDGPM